MASRWFKDSSTVNPEVQERCVREAVTAGAQSAVVAWALAAAVVLGGCKYSPRLAKSLGVSARTALVFSPGFGMFFLDAELKMNECARKYHHVRNVVSHSSLH